MRFLRGDFTLFCEKIKQKSYFALALSRKCSTTLKIGKKHYNGKNFLIKISHHMDNSLLEPFVADVRTAKNGAFDTPYASFGLPFTEKYIQASMSLANKFEQVLYVVVVGIG